MIGIYKIHHVASGRTYVGSSGCVEKRWARHKSDLRHQRHSSQKLQRAWDKYGADAFVLEVLEECEIADLRVREQHWMDLLESYKTGFNCTRKALEHSEEVRARLSQSKLGKTASTEIRRKMSESHKNNGLTPETQHMHTPEAKAKSATSRTGLAHSEERKRKIGEGGRGHHPEVRGPMSDETKARISEGNTGKVRSPEVREKFKNKIVTEETRRRMSDTAKARAATSEGRAHHKKVGQITAANNRSQHEDE